MQERRLSLEDAVASQASSELFGNEKPEDELNTYEAAQKPFEQSAVQQQNARLLQKQMGAKPANPSFKMSKTLSKNNMKLKLATEILGIRTEQAHKAKEEEKSVETVSKSGEHPSRELKSRKKIQLPLKIQNFKTSGATDAAGKKLVVQKSIERGSISNNSGGTGAQVFNSVTIRNIKNNMNKLGEDGAGPARASRP